MAGDGDAGAHHASAHQVPGRVSHRHGGDALHAGAPAAALAATARCAYSVRAQGLLHLFVGENDKAQRFVDLAAEIYKQHLVRGAVPLLCPRRH